MESYDERLAQLTIKGKNKLFEINKRCMLNETTPKQAILEAYLAGMDMGKAVFEKALQK